MIVDVNSNYRMFEKPEAQVEPEIKDVYKNDAKYASFLESILPQETPEIGSKQHSAVSEMKPDAYVPLMIDSVSENPEEEFEISLESSIDSGLLVPLEGDSMSRSESLSLDVPRQVNVELPESNGNVPTVSEHDFKNLPVPTSEVVDNTPLPSGQSLNKTSSLAEGMSSEIYEQSLYAIGKLSYRGRSEIVIQEASTTFAVDNTRSAEIQSIVVKTASSILSESAAKAANPIYSPTSQTKQGYDLAKDSTSSSKASAIAKNSDYLKNKVTVTEKSGELSLYIRDYFSSSDDQQLLIDQLVENNKEISHSFDRIVLNGKTYFIGKRG